MGRHSISLKTVENIMYWHDKGISGADITEIVKVSLPCVNNYIKSIECIRQGKGYNEKAVSVKLIKAYCRKNGLTIENGAIDDPADVLSKAVEEIRQQMRLQNDTLNEIKDILRRYMEV